MNPAKLARFDVDAVELVRSVANGNETVPTVIIGDIPMVNPSARRVRAVAESGGLPRPTRRRWLHRATCKREAT